jgi:NH3-dependent NAD+ synthetase
MSTERGSKKRKTRSGCSGIELASAFHVLQKFRDKIKTEDLVEPDDSNLESVELDMEIDEDALAQLDSLLEWMDSKIKSTKKVCPWLLVSYKRFHTRSRAARSRPPTRHS